MIGARRRALPIGRRAWWNDPKAPSTDAPMSKWAGDPIRQHNRLKLHQDRVKGHDPRINPPGFYELIASAIPLLPATESTRLKQSNLVANGVRRALLGAARPVALNYSKPGGLDRIRGPKFNPRLPALVPEALGPIVVHRMRGTQGPAQLVRLRSLAELADGGARTEKMGPMPALPLRRGFQIVGLT